ncbi:MAG: dihydropteridine reductase [Clostridia bacterium]|nr:dihydropteridine reductase [Clostridia bacterium]
MNTDKIYAEQIANEYAPKQTTKVIALKKLDKKAKRPAEIFTFTFGVISSLVLGTGMCLCMGAIGGGTPLSMIIGIGVGILGLVGCGVNYPIYKKKLEKGKQKYGSDIIRLAKEIAGDE